ncbi:MAG TPA: hypothetical protein VJP84_13960 [Steroidobacteraceae bacterium]|nr:hypothetical protein [Steroidobacteraceae bacterium]
MNAVRWLLAAMVLAAVAPLLASHADKAHASGGALPAWPHEFEGRPLTPIALTAEQGRLLADFPGAAARFSDGERDILMRWVTQPTRRLHPAEDCYRGWGFEVASSKIRADRDGRRWRCFEVTRDGVARQVCEQIRDADGANYTDVSSWYWDATLNRTQAPWLVVTVASAGAR